MKARRYIFLFTLFCIGSTAFSLSRKREIFEISNYSNKTVIITREYASMIPITGLHTRLHKINGYEFGILPDFIEASEIRLPPGQSITMVYISRYTSLLDEIPFMDKMNSIFESLEIFTEDGKLAITLENLEKYIEKNLVKRESTIGPRYSLEIYGND